MKALFSLISLLLVLALPHQSDAQTLSKDLKGDRLTVTMTADVASTDTVDFDSVDMDTYLKEATVVKYWTSTAGKPKLKVIRQGKPFGSWIDLKTLYTNDSLETLAVTADTLKGVTRFRIRVIGNTGNAADTQFKLRYEFLKNR